MTLHLDKWQQKVLDARGHFLLCTGRQVGKTTIFAIKAAKYMLENKNARIIVVSLTEDQAQLIIIMILTYLEKQHKHMLKRPYSKNQTKNKIVLNNGSQVLSRPVGNTGDAVRGFTGDILIIDEASRMSESVFTASKPTLLTTGGKIWMCSTPFGKQGYFYESWLNKHKRFEVFHISSEEVIHSREISESWTQQQREESIKMFDEEKKDMGTLQYSQEYLGLFMEDLRRFFSDEWIENVCKAKRRNININIPYFLGVDIARMGDDKGTFEIIAKYSKDSLHQVENIVTEKKLTTQTFDSILQLNSRWNFKQIGIDAGSGSLGVGIMDFLLREPRVSKKIIAVNNRKVILDKYGEKTRRILKEDLYENLRALGERGFLKLLDDEDLIISLTSIQIEHVMKKGMPTKIKIFGRDDHIAEGLTRAAWLANQKSINTSIDWI